MERGVNYILIGFCFIASLIGLVVFIFWFSHSGIFKPDMREYKSYTKESVNIKVDTPIKFKGINVGRVKSIKFRDNSFEEIEITLEIRKDLPIKKDSTIRIDQNGILGSTFISLIQNDKAKDFITSNDDVLILSKDPMSEVMSAIPNLTGKVNYLLDSANEVLNKNSVKTIAQILFSINEAANNINNIIKSLNKNTDDISRILKNVNEITANTDIIIKTINKKVQNGEYDFKSTITPSLISIEKAMEDISTFSKDGSAFIKKLNDNPYDTIFGYREEK